MPRNASDIYSIPPGTEGFPDTTIESDKYNTFVHDIEVDQNTPRPIVAGGTEAATADAALANLRAERAMQIVTNFDSHVWQTGSFYSATSATAPPVATHAFTGSAYVTAGGEIVLQAIDLTATTHQVYVRAKIGGAWQTWVAVGEANFVQLTGDVMTGTLSIAPPSGPATFQLIGPAGTNKDITGRLSGASTGMRWLIRPGDSAAETGGNVGSDFLLVSFGDDGLPLNAVLRGTRSDSLLSVKGDPTAALGIATKQYTDAAAAAAAAGLAPLANPVFTGNPTAPTPAVGDNDISIATTAFVKNGALLSPATDWNTITSPGTYTSNSNDNTNTPTGTGGYWYLFVLRYTDTNYCAQLASGVNTQNWYVRNKTAGTWTAWRTLTESDDWATIAQYIGNTANKLLVTQSVWGALARQSLSGPTFTPNFGTTIDFTLNLSSGANTINNATGAKEGQRGAFVMVTGTGSTLTWGTNYKFSGGVKPVPTATAGAVDIYSYFCGPTAIYVSAVQDMK